MTYRIYFERNGIEESLQYDSLWPLSHADAMMEIYNLLTEEPYSRQVPRAEDSIEFTFFSAGVDVESIRFEKIDG